MLTGKNLAFEVGNHEVFSGVDLSVSRGDKIGLIGPNGAGKTTLLRILTGEAHPSQGAVIQEDIEVGLLPQDLRPYHEQTVYDFVEEVTGVKAVKTAYEVADADYQANPNNESKLSVLVDAAERLGFYEVDEFDATLATSLKKAGLPEDVATYEIGALSGGQRTRVALAAIMATRYNVILLDEPTNNLDMEGIAILEKYIKASRADFLMVSHDRRFLRNVTNRIVELLGGRNGVNNYGLGYDEYVEARLNAYESELKRYNEHESNMKDLQASLREQRVRANSANSGASRRSDNDKLNANYRAGRAAGNLSKQARALETRIDQMKAEAPSKPQAPVTLDFMFNEGEFTNQTMLNVRDLCVTYDDTGSSKTFGPYNLHLRGGDRAVITGANGSGKTTLLKAIMGQAPVTAGTASTGTATKIAYIDQNQSLPSPQKSPLQNLNELAPGIDPSDAMNLLIKFNLNRDTVNSMRAAGLSGGERAKVLLAGVAASRANLLILDEPTNNLDIPTIEGLQEALKSYKGSILLVSHDREFIDGIGINQKIELK